MEQFVLFLTLFVMFIGVIGNLLPILPGTVITGLAAVLYAVWGDFQQISLGATLFITLITAVTGSADLWMPLLGAKAGGASTTSVMLWGTAGAVIGFILGSILPVVGSIIGGIVGYVAGLTYAEYQREKDWQKAVKAAVASLAGMGVATLIRLGGSLLIMAIFLWQLW